MGALFSHLHADTRIRAASLSQQHRDAFWAGEPIPMPWISALSAAGITVTPDLALTLSAFQSGVRLISCDLATLPCQTFKVRDDGGKDRVRPIFGAGIETSNGIGSLAYMLKWQPNQHQTATEFWLGQVAQYLLRGVAYAEIVARRGVVEQLLPRHPDRVQSARLPSGRIQYRLDEYRQEPRYLTQDDMFVVRDLSLDGGLSPASRVTYGAQSIGSALATQAAAGKFFKSGMTAAKIATYQGTLDEDYERQLHASISRFAAGVDNSFGLALIPDQVTITNLGVEPEKAQMMLAQEWGVREVARLLNLPGSKLGIKDSVGYGSQVQDALNYVITCLRTIAVAFEQAIQRDLIDAKDAYFTEFKIEALLRGDFESQSTYIERFIRNRVMRPSEARLLLNMNPDAELDKLSEGDFRPGSNGSQTFATPRRDDQDDDRQPRKRADLFDRRVQKALLAVHDQALRCVRRERHAVAQLARKHAKSAEDWQAGLGAFFEDHAHYVASTMRLSPALAGHYAAEHRAALATAGVDLHTDEWERYEADELAVLSLEEPRVPAPPIVVPPQKTVTTITRTPLRDQTGRITAVTEVIAVESVPDPQQKAS